MTEDIKDEMEEVFRTDMKTQERMTKVARASDPGEMAQAGLEVAEEMVGKVDDPQRKKYMWTTLLQIGKVSGSEEVAQAAAQRLEEWSNKYGGVQ